MNDESGFERPPERTCNLTSERDAPFSGYSVADLRESANYIAQLQNAPRRRFQRTVEPGWIAMSWVQHTLDALDLLEEIVEEWDQRGDGGCTKAIQDRVRQALRPAETEHVRDCDCSRYSTDWRCRVSA